MNKTGIEYLDYTWNVTHGCSPVSSGCANCWAKGTSKRLAGMGVRGYAKDDPFAVVCCPWKLNEPLLVKKPSRIGVSFMGDLFHEDVPHHFIRDVWDYMNATPRHRYMILTKRPKTMLEFIQDYVKYWRGVLPNIQLGVSVEDQQTADERIPLLLQTPAAVRYVSYEPALGPVDFGGIWAYCPTHDFEGGFCGGPCSDRQMLDGIILGGESGPGARPMHPGWARSVRDQCQAAGVPFFFKQWGEWGPCIEARHHPLDDNIKSRSWLPVPGQARQTVYYVGKKAAGRLLDGREHNELPEASHAS